MKSRITKKYSILVTIFSILHLACLFLPLCIYAPQGIEVVTLSSNSGSSVLLTVGTITCTVLFLISLMSSAVHRLRLHKSIIWIMLLVMALALENIKGFVIFMSITSILDEILINPIRTKCKEKLTINKEIDKR